MLRTAGYSVVIIDFPLLQEIFHVFSALLSSPLAYI